VKLFYTEQYGHIFFKLLVSFATVLNVFAVVFKSVKQLTDLCSACICLW